jgi:hypothetical protein
VAEYIRDPVNSNPVMDRIRDYVYGFAASTSAEERTKLLGCAKAAIDGYNEVSDVAKLGRRGQAAAFLYSGTMCAVSWFK